MDRTGETIIAAPRARVWQALNDPETLAQAASGGAAIAVRVTVVASDPTSGCRLQVEGRGDLAVRIEEVPEGTRLLYTVDPAVPWTDDFFREFNELLTDPPAVTDTEDAAETSADAAQDADLPPPPAETASPATADEAKAMDEAAEIVDEEVKALAPWLWISGLLLILVALLVAVMA